MSPRMVQTEQGVYLETEPVELVDIGYRASVVELLVELMSSEPSAAKEDDLYNEEGDRFSAQSVLLAALSLKKWQDFEKRALLFTLHRTDEQINLHITGRGADGLWNISKSECKSFDPKVSIPDLANSVASELLNAKAAEPPRLLGGPVLKDDPPPV